MPLKGDNGEGSTSMGESFNPATLKIACFGPFQLIPAERLLYREGEAVAVGSRQLDLLTALVERPGEVLSQRELMQRAWPDLVVEAVNLRVHIGHLRKVLGDGQDGARYIDNVAGRGYCFVASVQWTQELRQGENQTTNVTGRPTVEAPKLPPRLARMIGRDDSVAELKEMLLSRRFVSIVGAGGLGKTTIAVSVAHALAGDFDSAVYFVDLTSLGEEGLVVSAVATALGYRPLSQDPLEGLIAFLSESRLLLVLDNCEHIIEAAARLTERLVGETGGVHILATSRESLRVEGENVHLLPPLDSPPTSPALTVALCMASPAVRLFMDRAVAGGHRSALTDRDAVVVADICRRLDGVPLAIELVAGRVGMYGIQGTGDLLDSRFNLLWQARRSAMPRHQTLVAMLDWSYNLLCPRDKKILCVLSVLVGEFTLEAAQALADDAAWVGDDVILAVGSLVDKSLIWTTEVDGTIRFRLLDTTRVYAFEKLVESGDQHAVARRHALYFCKLLKEAAIDVLKFNKRDLSPYSHHVDNVRAALAWSFSSQSDKSIGTELAALATPLFRGLFLLTDCRRWCERGLAVLDASDRKTLKELTLQEGLAISAMLTGGNGEEVRSAIERGLMLAEALNEGEHQLQLLAGLHLHLVIANDFLGALAIAKRSAAVAAGIEGVDARIMAEWMLGTSYYLLGKLEVAQHHCEMGFNNAVSPVSNLSDFFGFDHRIRALIVQALVLWLRGFPDRAAVTAEQAIDEAELRADPLNRCITVVYTASIFILRGDLDTAERRIKQIGVLAGRHGLRPYRILGTALTGELAVARGDFRSGIELLRSALADLQTERHNVATGEFACALADAFVQCGQFAEAAATVDRRISSVEPSLNTFEMPELLRARAEIWLAQPEPDPVAAEQALLRSVEIARSQGALASELRSANVLARHRLTDDRRHEARELLATVFEKFTEGHHTTDLKNARRLLDAMK